LPDIFPFICHEHFFCTSNYHRNTSTPANTKTHTTCHQKSGLACVFKPTAMIISTPGIVT
jgi:hypothetical protein